MDWSCANTATINEISFNYPSIAVQLRLGSMPVTAFI